MVSTSAVRVLKVRGNERSSHHNEFYKEIYPHCFKFSPNFKQEYGGILLLDVYESVQMQNEPSLSHLLSTVPSTEAWKSLTDKVQEARSNAQLQKVSFEGEAAVFHITRWQQRFRFG